MKVIILFFLGIGLFLPGCKEKPAEESEMDEVMKEFNEGHRYNDIRDYPEIQAETNADTLINQMAMTDCVFDKYVGLGGMYSMEYARFERLVQLLDEKALFKLIYHENSEVRLYAYQGLILKRPWYRNMFGKSQYEIDAKQILLADTINRVCIFSGCIQMGDMLFPEAVDFVESSSSTFSLN